MLRSEGEQPSLTVRCASPRGASHEGGGAPACCNLSSPHLPYPHIPALRHSRGPPRAALRAVPARGWGHRTGPTPTPGGERGWWVQLQSHPEGLASQRPASRPRATLAIAQIPAMPRNKVPRATTGSAWPLPAACGDTRVPGASPGPSRCSWFPAASPSLDGSPMAMAVAGEGWVPGASPHCQQVLVLSGEAAVALRPGLLCGCWCPAGRVAAQGHWECHDVHRGAQSLGGAQSPGAATNPPCLAMTQMCFRAQPRPTQLLGFARAAAPLAPG